MPIFSLILVSIAPLLMILTSVLWRSNPPNRNSFFSYRTEASMLSDDTWEFAHEQLGLLFVIFGFSTLIPSLGIIFLLNHFSRLILVGVLVMQAALFIYAILQLEKALKNNFLDGGKRKSSIPSPEDETTKTKIRSKKGDK